LVGQLYKNIEVFMTSIDAPTEPKSIIELLRVSVLHGKQIAAKPVVSNGNLKLWTSSVRSRLLKLYGKDGPQLSFFSLGTAVLPEQKSREELISRIEHLERIIEGLENLPKITQAPQFGSRIFIGHGRSPLWRELKDFIADRLHLAWDEFNREATAGYTTTDRLQTMISQAAFAFLIMTAEEEHADSSIHARPNVIHEVGLFQGRLGLRRAIVLLEEGCSEFSNIIGLSQIRFPPGDISARFEEIRRVLEREGLL
jgi:predicted nucleotide-binding protein